MSKGGRRLLSDAGRWLGVLPLVELSRVRRYAAHGEAGRQSPYRRCSQVRIFSIPSPVSPLATVDTAEVPPPRVLAQPRLQGRHAYSVWWGMSLPSDVDPIREIIPGLRSTDLRWVLRREFNSHSSPVSRDASVPGVASRYRGTSGDFAELTMVSLTSARGEAWISISLQTELRMGPRPVVQGVPTPYITIRGCGPLGVRGAVDGPSG